MNILLQVRQGFEPSYIPCAMHEMIEELRLRCSGPGKFGRKESLQEFFFLVSGSVLRRFLL